MFQFLDLLWINLYCQLKREPIQSLICIMCVCARERARACAIFSSSSRINDLDDTVQFPGFEPITEKIAKHWLEHWSRPHNLSPLFTGKWSSPKESVYFLSDSQGAASSFFSCYLLLVNTEASRVVDSERHAVSNLPCHVILITKNMSFCLIRMEWNVS